MNKLELKFTIAFTIASIYKVHKGTFDNRYARCIHWKIQNIAESKQARHK